MKCGQCGDKLTVNMEWEHSVANREYFCDVGCAHTFMTEITHMLPVERKERVRLLREEPEED